MELSTYKANELRTMAQLAEVVGDIKTMQTYMKVFIDKKIEESKMSSATSINRDSIVS